MLFDTITVNRGKERTFEFVINENGTPVMSESITFYNEEQSVCRLLTNNVGARKPILQELPRSCLTFGDPMEQCIFEIRPMDKIIETTRHGADIYFADVYTVIELNFHTCTLRAKCIGTWHNGKYEGDDFEAYFYALRCGRRKTHDAQLDRWVYYGRPSISA